MSWMRLRARKAISALSDDPSGAQPQQPRPLWSDDTAAAAGDKISAPDDVVQEQRRRQADGLRGSVTQARRCDARSEHTGSDGANTTKWPVTVESTWVRAGRVLRGQFPCNTRGWQDHSRRRGSTRRRVHCCGCCGLLPMTLTFHGSHSCLKH